MSTIIKNVLNKKFVISCIIALSLGFSFSHLTANAVFLPRWYHSKTIPVSYSSRLTTPTSRIRVAYSNGMAEWRSTNGINFSVTSGSNNILTSHNDSASSVIGRMTATSYSGTRLISFAISINASHSGITNTNWAKSTATHEFGHVLGLNDRQSGNTSIMSHNRNRTTIHRPQTQDITNVRSLYP